MTTSISLVAVSILSNGCTILSLLLLYLSLDVNDEESELADDELFEVPNDELDLFMVPFFLELVCFLASVCCFLTFYDYW